MTLQIAGSVPVTYGSSSADGNSGFAFCKVYSYYGDKSHVPENNTDYIILTGYIHANKGSAGNQTGVFIYSTTIPDYRIGTENALTWGSLVDGSNFEVFNGSSAPWTVSGQNNDVVHYIQINGPSSGGMTLDQLSDAINAGSIDIAKQSTVTG